MPLSNDFPEMVHPYHPIMPLLNLAPMRADRLLGLRLGQTRPHIRQRVGGRSYVGTRWALPEPGTPYCQQVLLSSVLVVDVPRPGPASLLYRQARSASQNYGRDSSISTGFSYQPPVKPVRVTSFP